MPPRYAFWTILIDNQPTAFRARDRDELLPTAYQLRRTNANVVLKWFARGRLWNTPDEARAAARAPKLRERRGPAWRPGGQHADPRAKFHPRTKRHPNGRAAAARSAPASPPPKRSPKRPARSRTKPK